MGDILSKSGVTLIGLLASLSAQPWGSYAHDPQHTALSPIAAQPLSVVRWSTPVDLVLAGTPGELLIHYGSPLVTAGNTVLLPVRTSSSNSFQVQALDGASGTLKYTLSTDYSPPPHDWIPSYGPVLSAGTRLYYPGAGGTVYYRDQPDSTTGPSGQIAFYGNALYAANQSTFNSNVQISTPITAAPDGTIFFGFRVQGANPANLESGIARISSSGVGSWVSATVAAGGDTSITTAPLNCTPALSNDNHTLYFGVSSGGWSPGYLVSVDSGTLQPIAQVRLKDPETGQDAQLLDDGSASPTVGPDGDVYYGVLESTCCTNDDRGWLLHFDGSLAQTKIPGAFGWDTTASVVPAGLVSSYHGASTYLVFTKYNNYAGLGPGGNGHNKVAVLDPNTSMSDPITGATVMQEVITILGVTPDPPGNTTGAVREWCINSAAIDSVTKSAIVNSEDGVVYRWDFGSNSFTQQLRLAAGVGEAYTPTIIGVDGTAYAINDGYLFAVGNASLMMANAGTTPQAAPVTRAFGTALAVTVTDDNSYPVEGVVVTFTAPAQTGPSGTFANNTGTTQATTGTNGVATATMFTANTQVGGPYNVAATASGLTTVNFALTNTVGVSAVSVTPNSGGGVGPRTFSAVYSDLSGAFDLQVVYLYIGPAAGASHSCYVAYVQASNALYLYNDSGSGILGPLTESAGGSVSNSQCTLSGGSTAVNSSGNNLTVPFTLTFASGFDGLKNIYGLAQSYNGTETGWQALGTWTPATAIPGTVSVTPNSGSGAGPQVFNATFSDTGGASDLQAVYLDFGSMAFASHDCIAVYAQASNALYLFNDANSGALGPIVLGAGSSVSNSQCTLSGGNTPATLSGNNLTVPFSITFLAGYSGEKTIFGLAQSYNGSQSGGGVPAALGTWTPAASALGVVSVTPNSGSGAGPQVFSAVYSDANGANDLQVVYLDFGSVGFAAHNCIVAYVPGPNALYLLNDDSSSALGPISEGAGGGRVSNSQCSLSSGTTAATLSGNNLTVPFTIQFLTGYGGLKQIFGLAQSYDGTQSGGGIPKDLGTWTPAESTPSGVSLNPNSGGGLGPQLFTAAYSDTGGASDLQVVYLSFGAAFMAANSCNVGYEPGNNQLFLFSDNNGTVATLGEGGPGNVSNSQCTLSGGSTAASSSGNNLTVPFTVTFKSGFVGSKTAFSLAQTYNGTQGAVTTLGSWTP